MNAKELRKRAEELSREDLARVVQAMQGARCAAMDREAMIETLIDTAAQSDEAAQEVKMLLLYEALDEEGKAQIYDLIWQTAIQGPETVRQYARWAELSAQVTA